MARKVSGISSLDMRCCLLSVAKQHCMYSAHFLFLKMLDVKKTPKRILIQYKRNFHAMLHAYSFSKLAPDGNSKHYIMLYVNEILIMNFIRLLFKLVIFGTPVYIIRKPSTIHHKLLALYHKPKCYAMLDYCCFIL